MKWRRQKCEKRPGEEGGRNDRLKGAVGCGGEESERCVSRCSAFWKGSLERALHIKRCNAHTGKQTQQLVSPQKQRGQEADISDGELWLCLPRCFTHRHTWMYTHGCTHPAHFPLCPAEYFLIHYAHLHVLWSAVVETQAFKKKLSFRIQWAEIHFVLLDFIVYDTCMNVW